MSATSFSSSFTALGSFACLSISSFTFVMILSSLLPAVFTSPVASFRSVCTEVSSFLVLSASVLSCVMASCLAWFCFLSVIFCWSRASFLVWILSFACVISPLSSCVSLALVHTRLSSKSQLPPHCWQSIISASVHSLIEAAVQICSASERVLPKLQP